MSVLQASVRDPKANSKQLRRDGLIPFALVSKTETQLLQAPTAVLRKALSHATGAGVVDIQIDDQKSKTHAMVKSIDHDPIKRAIIHVTFMQVSAGDSVKADLPVVGVGTPPALEDHSGTLVRPIDHVTVRGKLSALPDHLEVDLAAMVVGQTVHASDLVLPKGVELMSSGDSILFSLQAARDLMADIAAEQAAEAEAAAAAEAAPEETV